MQMTSQSAIERRDSAASRVSNNNPAIEAGQNHGTATFAKLNR